MTTNIHQLTSRRSFNYGTYTIEHIDQWYLDESLCTDDYYVFHYEEYRTHDVWKVTHEGDTYWVHFYSHKGHTISDTWELSTDCVTSFVESIMDGLKDVQHNDEYFFTDVLVIGKDYVLKSKDEGKNNFFIHNTISCFEGTPVVLRCMEDDVHNNYVRVDLN